MTGQHPRDPALAAFFGLGMETATGISVTPETAMRSAAVYACVRVLTDTLSTLPVHVHERARGGGRVRLDDHPATLLLGRQPYRALDSVQWRQMLMGHLALRGNAYAEIVLANDGSVAELIPLHPDRVRPYWAPDGRRAYEYFPERGERRILLQQEVLHLMGLSFDGLKGLNPIELHRETVGLSLASQQYGARFFGNGAMPKGGIEMGNGKLEEEAVKNFWKAWDARHRGVENMGRPALFHGGMKWVNIGMTNEDAQYIETMGFTAVDIARVFRVPPHKIGILDRATFSNIEHQALEFVQDTVMPIVIAWEAALDIALFSEAERRTRYVKFNLDGLLRGDFKSRQEGLAIQRQNGIINADEWRGIEDKAPIGGDAGGLYLVQSNMAPTDKLAEMQAQKARQPQPPKAPPEQTEEKAA
ncbi:MAG: phage portal protein [Reyranella sp.]